VSVARVIETGATPEEYDKVRARVDADGKPAGLVIHVGALTDDGKVRLFELWETRDQAEEFSKKVMAVRAELGVGGGGPPPIQYLDVHNVIE
jgi:hypothetical protein